MSVIDLPGHDGYGADTYGESFADVYDDWYADVSDIDATVATIARLAGDGPVLELGVGTGRLAIPLAAAGVRVVGVDASPSMLRLLADMAHLAEGPGAEEIAAAGPYTVAFAAFNTFFNLATPDDQRRCLEGVFDLLAPGGVLVIEGFVPPEDGMADGGVSVRDITSEAAVLTVSKHDPHAQVIRGHHIEMRTDGNRMRPWIVRYLTPEQLDASAAAVGFVKINRWATWSGSPFNPSPPNGPDHPLTSSDVHVSVYQHPSG
ncbi:MAG: class I SAM-dependent methyltransferase [Actinobacteria bacterium]|nr:class I SAM-dependent methyltransferase [Actinomycetota bacterium]